MTEPSNLPALFNLDSVSLHANEISLDPFTFKLVSPLRGIELAGNTLPAQLKVQRGFLHDSGITHLRLERIGNLSELSGKIESLADLRVSLTGSMIPLLAPGIFDAPTIYDIAITDSTIWISPPILSESSVQKIMLV